ncbi:MAG: adenylate/guanylate cyclase domain-containing protein [Verrucomicrobiota bacterium]
MLLALGLPLLAVIVVMGLFTYRTLVDTRLSHFRQRLSSVALSLSQTVDISRVGEVDLDSPDSPEWLTSLHSRLRTIAEREEDIESIYIMLPTEELGHLRFLLDASILTRVAVKGEAYDATEIPFMLRGFEEVTVEDRIYSDEFGDTQSSYAPLRNNVGAVVGVLGVDVLAVRVEAIRDRVLHFCLWLFGSAGLVVAALTVAIGRWVRAPLQRLFSAANAVAAGDLETRMELDRRDEFGVVAGQFDRMAERLRRQRCLHETFGLYVSRELADRLLEQGQLPALGGEECEATILFLDLCSYTRVSEQLSPEETIGMLNHYLGAVIAIIEEHQGCVLDIMGDAIIAIFGAPLPLADHAPKALDCALRVRQCLDGLNADWERDGLAQRWRGEGIDRIEVRLGLHTGHLIAGNIGSASRMKFSVIGDTVNVASRLEQLNKELNTSILFTEELRTRLRIDQSTGLTDHGQVAVRGRSQPIRVWSV